MIASVSAALLRGLSGSWCCGCSLGANLVPTWSLAPNFGDWCQHWVWCDLHCNKERSHVLVLVPHAATQPFDTALPITTHGEDTVCSAAHLLFCNHLLSLHCSACTMASAAHASTGCTVSRAHAGTGPIVAIDVGHHCICAAITLAPKVDRTPEVINLGLQPDIAQNYSAVLIKKSRSIGSLSSATYADVEFGEDATVHHHDGYLFKWFKMLLDSVSADQARAACFAVSWYHAAD